MLPNRDKNGINSEKKNDHKDNSTKICSTKICSKNTKDACKIICNHAFISDDIDVTPDRSQRITYCTKCFITK